MLIVFPNHLYQYFIKKLKESSSEIGFYLIGLIYKNFSKAIIYDLIEMAYDSRSSAHINSNPIQKNIILQSLPVGLNLIGNLHSHPFLNGDVSPSHIDIQTFEEYKSGIFLISNAIGDIYSYFIRDKKLMKAKLEIRNLFDIEKPLIRKFDDNYLFYNKDISRWELMDILYEGFIRESLLSKSILKISIDRNFNIEISKPNWIYFLKILSDYIVPYKLHFFTKDSLVEKIKLIFGKKANFYNTYKREKRVDIIGNIKEFDKLIGKDLFVEVD